MDFNKFRREIDAQWKKISSGTRRVYRVKLTGDQLWAAYLDAFPPGTNEVYRTRREYDCNCCRSYVRNLGLAVSVENGQLRSIWGGKVSDPNFAQVAAVLDQLVTSAPIDGPWFSSTPVIGVEHNHMLTESGESVRWNHFWSEVPRRLVIREEAMGPARNTAQGDHDTLARALGEFTTEAVATVMDLIRNNAIYRGDQYQRTVTQFQTLQASYANVPGDQRDAWIWSQTETLSGDVSRIRNTAIGTLISDLSTGVDLTRAVRSFEEKVAPGNYQRTTAIVTPTMVKAARKTVEELGLTASLERRLAEITDVSINDVIWANPSARGLMKTQVETAFDRLASRSTARRKATATQGDEITLDHFIDSVIPTATSVEVLFSGDLTNRLVSITTASDPAAPGLFKWDNPFAWSYSGEVTDSIRQRVKSAGGRVSGEVLVRLAWFNRDDLDLSVVVPGNRIIYYGSRTAGGGTLDVDMNAFSKLTTTPVENIYFDSLSNMKDGEYQVFVNQFQQRDTKDPGFTVEIEIQGQVTTFSRTTALKGKVEVARFRVKAGKVTVTPVMPVTPSGANRPSEKIWGVDTETWVKVKTIMDSPNYWGGQAVGTRHRFLILDGVSNPDPTRGFYNEFLTDRLRDHRRVMELVGADIRAQPNPGGLAGLGFNQTQPGQFRVRVTGDRGTREYQVTI